MGWTHGPGVCLAPALSTVGLPFRLGDGVRDLLNPKAGGAGSGNDLFARLEQLGRGGNQAGVRQGAVSAITINFVNDREADILRGANGVMIPVRILGPHWPQALNSRRAGRVLRGHGVTSRAARWRGPGCSSRRSSGRGASPASREP